MDIDTIITRVDTAKNFYSGMMSAFATRANYARGKYSITLPENVVAYKDITPVTNVDVAANAIVTDIPTFNLQLPHDCTEADETRRDKQLRALMLLFKESEKAKIPPLRDSAINISKYGAFCMSLWWLEESFDVFDFNFLWKSHNPETILPIGRDEFAEIYSVRLSDVEELLAEFNAGKKKKVVDWAKSADTGETVEIVKYSRSWKKDGEWEGGRTILIDKTPIFKDSSISKGGVQKNLLGVCPYVYGVSGWAGSSADGKPEEEARGINDMAFPIFNQISFIQSMAIAKLAKDVVGRKIRNFSDDQIGYGDNLWDDIVLDDGISLDRIKSDDRTQIDPDAYRMLPILRQQVSDQTFGAGAKGVQQGSSGSQEAVLIGQDLKKMRIPRAQIETVYEQICQKMFYIAKQHGGVTYNGKPILKPADIMFPINLDISLEPIDPVQQQAKILMLKEVWVAGGISWENFAIRSGIVDDITLERKLIEVNKTMNDPALRQIIGQQAAMAWGMQEQIDTLNEMTSKKKKSNPANMGVYGSAATATEVNNMKTQMGQFGGMDTQQMVPQGQEALVQ